MIGYALTGYRPLTDEGISYLIDVSFNK